MAENRPVVEDDRVHPFSSTPMSEHWNVEEGKKSSTLSEKLGLHELFSVKIKVESLKGKKLGLYFSASWCCPCQRFTPSLVEAYNELSPKGDFEVVFISADKDDESFNGYFSKMPWLAIPFSDSEARGRVDKLFKVRGIPHLVILGEDGKVLSDSGVEIIQEHGVDGYPFTPEKIKELNDQEEAARRDQSLKTILVSRLRVK